MAPEAEGVFAAGTEELRREVIGATAELNAAVEQFTTDHGTGGEDVGGAQRMSVISAAHKLLRAVKEPLDQWLDYGAQIAQVTSTRLFWEWGVFNAIPLEGSISYAELAAKTGTEEALLMRTAHVLVGYGTLVQTPDGSVAHTRLSRAFVDGEISGMVFHMIWENAFVPYARYGEYFKKYGRKEPQTLNHVPDTFAWNVPEETFYEMLANDPPRMDRTAKGMMQMEERMPIAGIYDFSWVVAKAQEDGSSNRPLFVDVGGGHGQAIKAIHNEFPGLPLNRCVLQDRPEVIESVMASDDEETKQFQKMVIDFHKEQPLQGALVYWIRRCVHNYSDDITTNILRILAGAMAEDSKILIQEDVADDPPHPAAAWTDFMMMGCGGKQRSLRCWEKVTGNAGLKINGVSTGQGAWLAVIECVKK